ncbi:MAG: hypothetical protein HOV80_30500 [Polyangiaceae bacterium]|nr:hypothetical protein [Polyangiaceae bacterium]
MNDPARLLDNPGSDLDVLLLESGLDEEPPARIADRTLVALGVASAAAGAGAGAIGASAASIKAGAGTLGWWAGPWALVAKVGIGVAVVGGIAGGGYAVMTPPAEPAAVVAPATPQETTGSEKSGSEKTGATLDNTGPTSEKSGAAEAAVVADPVERAAEAGAASKAAEGAASEPAKADVAAKPSKAPDASKPGTTKPGASAPAKTADSGSTLAQERQIIESARASLRNGDKAGAIATLDTYPARFPKGQLRNEVAAMRQAIVASP